MENDLPNENEMRALMDGFVVKGEAIGNEIVKLMTGQPPILQCLIIQNIGIAQNLAFPDEWALAEKIWAPVRKGTEAAWKLNH